MTMQGVAVADEAEQPGVLVQARDHTKAERFEPGDEYVYWPN
jgi:hypothetical protein